MKIAKRENIFMTGRKSFLLVSRVGAKSLHHNWLDDITDRNFDVFLSSYDGNLGDFNQEGVQTEHRPGYKIKGYNGFLNDHVALWSGYDYVCFMDEDIDVDVASLNKMFRLSAKYNLKIAQPSLTHDSYFSYASLLHQRPWKLRYVNFIEMMCPVFRVDVLAQIAPLYGLGYEVGIDLIWCNLVFNSETDFAVLDSVQIRHTEPVGTQKKTNGFPDGKSYEDDMNASLAQFNLPRFRCIPYAAVDHLDTTVHSRTRLKLAALALAPSVFYKRPVGLRLRCFLAHLYHLQFLKAENQNFQMPK
jgi:hypothetical protein